MAIVSKTVLGRRVRTFGRRLGRKLAPNRAEFVSERLANFSIEGMKLLQSDGILLKADKIWKNCADQRRLLEIGFGSGEYLMQRLKEEDLCVLGAEVYMPGIASFFSNLERRKEIKNLPERLRIYSDDVRILLTRLSDNIFDEIVILFPDPWSKKRHNKRRLINEEFLEELSRVLRSDGVVKIASDHKDLMLWMIEKFENCGWTCKDSDSIFHEGCLGEDYLENFRNFPEGWQPTRYQQKALQTSYYAEYLRPY